MEFKLFLLRLFFLTNSGFDCLYCFTRYPRDLSVGIVRLHPRVCDLGSQRCLHRAQLGLAFALSCHLPARCRTVLRLARDRGRTGTISRTRTMRPTKPTRLTRTGRGARTARPTAGQAGWARTLKHDRCKGEGRAARSKQRSRVDSRGGKQVDGTRRR